MLQAFPQLEATILAGMGHCADDNFQAAARACLQLLLRLRHSLSAPSVQLSSPVEDPDTAGREGSTPDLAGDAEQSSEAENRAPPPLVPPKEFYAGDLKPPGLAQKGEDNAVELHPLQSPKASDKAFVAAPANTPDALQPTAQSDAALPVWFPTSRNYTLWLSGGGQSSPPNLVPPADDDCWSFVPRSMDTKEEASNQRGHAGKERETMQLS